MILETVFTAVTAYFSGTLGQIELMATIASLICVYLATKHNIWTWFFGAIGVILFGYLFFQYLLYSDAILQIFFYLPIQVVGWVMWRRSAQEYGTTTVRRLTGLQTLLIAVGTILAAGAMGWVMSTYTAASFPYIDALTTWMSITAQLLMLKKYLENWIVWVSMDAIAIFVYLAKGLVVTSGLYVIFFFLASYGLYVWWKQYREQTAEGILV